MSWTGCSDAEEEEEEEDGTSLDQLRPLSRGSHALTTLHESLQAAKRRRRRRTRLHWVAMGFHATLPVDSRSTHCVPLSLRLSQRAHQKTEKAAMRVSTTDEYIQRSGTECTSEADLLPKLLRRPSVLLQDPSPNMRVRLVARADLDMLDRGPPRRGTPTRRPSPRDFHARLVPPARLARPSRPLPITRRRLQQQPDVCEIRKSPLERLARLPRFLFIPLIRLHLLARVDPSEG